MKYFTLHSTMEEYNLVKNSLARPHVAYVLEIQDIVTEEDSYTPLSLSVNSLSFSGSGGSESVTVTSPSYSWTASTTDEWITISQLTGDTGSTSISISVDTSYEVRNGSVSFTDGTTTVMLTVSQEAAEIPYSQRYLTFDVLTGGTIMWVANNNETKTISYSINDGEWTQITSTAEGAAINVSAGDKVRIKGNNARYASAKDTASMFSGGTAAYDAYGNVMSLIGGDNFSGLTSFNNQQWAFHDLFNTSNVVSAKNLIMPVTTLTNCCYRAMFAHSKKLTEAPELPATTLATSGYCYIFQECTSLTTAPDLLAETIVDNCYTGMFNSASTLNYIKCTATSGIAAGNTKDWTKGVASSGTFIKASSVSVSTWTTGVNGIPTTWVVYDDVNVETPVIAFDGFDTIEITCGTEGADIFYKLNNVGEYSAYTTPIVITADTFIETYATYSGETSRPATQTCQYVSSVPIEYSNRDLKNWVYANQEITTPYSINAIDGHSSNYAKGSFNFETSFALKEAEPTYLWFQHADQSAEIYVDNTLVEKHWGGYAAFTTDISQYVHSGTNNVKVILKNNEGNNLAPAEADFNFNATLGNVRLLTSPYVPAMSYGYDGFHVTSTVSDAEATINIMTSVPTGATLICKIDDGNTNIYSATSASTGEEMTFTKVITNPHLWNGKSDPYLYTITLEIYGGNDLYHRFVRPYGLRYYEYLVNDTTKIGTAGNPFTGFILNGSPYLLRGVCMHDDIDGKANALNDTDYDNTFATIQELGCNFIRLAHYPHPKEVYDRCDALGIVVQTEGPCVNKLQSTMPEQYYTHLTGQYTDMVNQHYNHPCILFWGLSNETSTDDKAFGKQKVEEYTALIKNLDSERMVGYVLAQGNGTSPSAYYNDPSNVDWFGCNIYVGWYDSPNSNTPVSQINTRLNNTINRVGKPMAYSEYGCGGTPTCHSDDFMTTTTRGNNPRHDIEYMMWLHEGHIATIKQYPQLMFTSQWQLFDIAVSKRNEGYTVCLDGVNTSIDDNLRRLNNKGLVERDHVTKKDTFYLYKAWWNTTDKFVHICGKNYQKVADRAIKCYTNDGNSLTLYVNGTSAETVTVTDNIAVFTARNFNDGDTIMVSGATSNDSFNIIEPQVFCRLTLNNSTTVNITGSGRLTSAMTSAYTATCVSAEVGKLCTSIGDGAFYEFTGLTSVTLSDTVTSIGNEVFEFCLSITSITIPNSVRSIGDWVFNTCNELTTVVMPSGITSIGEGIFYSCTALTSVNIPSGITSISRDAFNGCFKLPNIDIPSGVTSIGSGAFSSCKKFTSIIIPSGITEIDGSVFYNCDGLTSVTIPNSVTSIGYSAFRDCDSLASITIPSGVTSFGNYCFYYCINLTGMTIPSGVTSIGQYCFEGCSKLGTIISNPTTAPTVDTRTFKDIKTGGTLTVPQGSTGYDVWMGSGDYYLGKYNWTKVEQ